MADDDLEDDLDDARKALSEAESNYQAARRRYNRACNAVNDRWRDRLRMAELRARTPVKAGDRG